MECTGVPRPRMTLLVVLPVLLVAASPAAQNAQPTSTGLGVIAGTVVDRETGRRLQDAIVTLRASVIDGVLATTSDAEGRYLFEGLAPGSYRVSADLDGYTPDQFRVFGTREWPGPSVAQMTRDGYKTSGGAAWLELADGQRQNNVDLEMVRGGHLRGRVTNDDGLPAHNAHVTAMPLLDDGRFGLAEHARTRSNERGEYVLRDLAPGPYIVSAIAADPARLKALQAPDRRPTFFPGTGRREEATSILVARDTTARNIDFSLRPNDLFRVSGKVLRGRSEGSIEAHLLTGESSVRSVTVGQDGDFDVTHVPSGRQVLWARAATMDGWEAAFLDLSLGSDMLGLVMPLAPSGTISGRVMMEDGISFSADGTQLIAELVDADGTRLDPLPRDRVDIGSDGAFELVGLFGHRMLRLSGTDFSIARVLVGTQPVDVFSVASGEHIDEVLVVVRPNNMPRKSVGPPAISQ